MSSHIFVKCSHPDHDLRVLTVKVEALPQGDYVVKAGRITEVKKVGKEIESHPGEWFDADVFSERLKENGFDEVEVRFEIEEAIEAREQPSDGGLF